MLKMLKSPVLRGIWGRMKAAPKSAINTLRGLTPSLKLAERGFVKPTQNFAKIPHTDEERMWDGHPARHPDEVWDKLYMAGRPRLPWSTFEIKCDEPMCLDLNHVKVITPTRLNYPTRVCTYCGLSAGTRDHIMPRTWSGESYRSHILTVPSCGECNSIIGDKPIYSIDGRRAHAQRRLAEKKFKVLGYETMLEVELEEYGPGLRSVMEAAAHQREHLESRLLWPDDIEYDIRYLQKSGIEDPQQTGLLDTTPEVAKLEREVRFEQASRAARMKRRSLTLPQE